MHESEVIKASSIWKRKEVNEDLIRISHQFLIDQMNHLTETWLSSSNSAPYKQSYDKINSYLLVVAGANGDKTLCKELLYEVEQKIHGLLRNWREEPNDKCIPKILENYCYVRSVMEFREAGLK